MTLVLAGAGVGAYVLARQSSVFALNRIEVEGAPPEVASEVRATLAQYRGTSLVSFDSPAAPPAGSRASPKSPARASTARSRTR